MRILLRLVQGAENPAPPVKASSASFHIGGTEKEKHVMVAPGEIALRLSKPS